MNDLHIIGTWQQGGKYLWLAEENAMSNSSRIESATRSHVGATLTTEQIQELVKVSDPTNKKGVYPSDCAGKRLEDGTLTHRGKVAYGDLILEFISSNNYKVLPTDQIVRRKNPSPAPTAPSTSTGTTPPAPKATTGFVEEKAPAAPPAQKAQKTKKVKAA